MRKVAPPLFILLVLALLLVGGRFATVRSAAASPAMAAAAIAAPAPVTFTALDLPPPTLDVPALPSAATLESAKRSAIAIPKPRGIYRCEIHPLQMGTVDTAVQSCAWRDR